MFEYENVFYLKRCNEEVKEQIKNMLILHNREFIPPLSKRYKNGIDGYFDYVLDSSAIIVKNIKGEVIAFLTYKVTDEELYIKTILVSKKYRNKDIETKLYEMVLEVNNRKVRIKSWSTNTDQIKILKKLGFVEEKIIKNDREINVDTIYFVKN